LNGDARQPSPSTQLTSACVDGWNAEISAPRFEELELSVSSRLAAAQLKYSNEILVLEVEIDQTTDCIVSCKLTGWCDESSISDTQSGLFHM
jgi:hypothetical protein